MRWQLISSFLASIKKKSTSSNDSLKDLLSYKIIFLLALGTGGLSAYTAIHRWHQIHSQPKPLMVKSLTHPENPHLTLPTTPPALDIEKAQKTQDLQNLLPRNILFTYVHYKAKKVSLTGDFNQWIAQDMSKEKIGVWRLSFRIEPGIYKYNFIVDGKKVTDPYNPRREKDSSILIVEPIEKKR